MKVYSCPAECPAPEPDYANYDFAREEAREQEHMAQLKDWLTKAGYTGKHTGGILRLGAGDGYAQYMLAEGNPTCLIHLPYGDAWQSELASRLTKKEVIARIESDKKIASIFRGAD